MSQASATVERDEQLNADFSKGAFADTAAMDWQASPAPGVWRKRLELDGGAEGGRVTSVVRYDAGSVFAEHGHPGGEELFVLDGEGKVVATDLSGSELISRIRSMLGKSE